jgi:hypothetical protein
MEPKLLCKKLRFTCPHDDKEHIYRLWFSHNVREITGICWPLWAIY